MKIAMVIIVQVLLILLSLVQVIRILGRDHSDRIIGAILLSAFMFVMVAIHRWYKRTKSNANVRNLP